MNTSQYRQMFFSQRVVFLFHFTALSALVPPVLVADELGNGYFVSVQFSGDGSRLLTASFDKRAQIWDVASGKETRCFVGHTERLRSAVFSPNEKLVVTAAGAETPAGNSYPRDNTARVWNASTGAQIKVLHKHEGAVHTAFFSPDGTRVLTAAKDGGAIVWNWRTAEVLCFLQGLNAYCNPSFSPDGALLLASLGGRDSHVAQIWDAREGKLLHRLDGHVDNITALHFSDDGKFVLSASRDGAARIWDVGNGKPIQLVRRNRDGSVQDAVFSPDGTRILTASENGNAQLWSCATGLVIREFEHAGPLRSALFSSDGTRIVTQWRSGELGDPSTKATLWNARTGKMIRQFELRPGPFAIFTPDGGGLLTATTPTSLWDSQTGQLLRMYE